MRVGSADEQFEGKNLERPANLRFQRRLSNIILQYCTAVTALRPTRKADTDKLSKLAV